MSRRPRPPVYLLNGDEAQFVPTPELQAWAGTAVIAEDAALVNEDHAHLRLADIGFLWTNVENSRRGRRIIGQAELGEPQGAMGKWAKARAEAQVRGWFGEVPDFIITIDATYAAECGDAEFCALVEHELYHCGQERDPFGAPRFNRYGQPIWTMRGHDVEEFVGVVRRYGAEATGVRDLVEAANRGPEISGARVAHLCGTCGRSAA
ncbi:UNVERIFIED_ORG: hypothetical protein ABID33_000244 [Xanthobacter viscosus]|uniref:putative metallopeptidase n=1 Tax=Xanthobacter autotrophicus TaxID=280 RepID=UPI001FE9E691|nr:putative metallopeptidase [Xanthobacter autotrophicus]